MAQVRINRNYDLIEPPAAFGLKRRQLLFIILGAAVGFIIYFSVRKYVGATTALTLMVCSMMPVFIVGNYKKRGYYLEQYFKAWFVFRFTKPGLRLFDTGNIYEKIRNEIYREEVLGVDEHFKKKEGSGRKGKNTGKKKHR